MGFRFSKSFKVGPGRINLSRRGIGASVGTKGFRVGAGPSGAYKSISIPGTGLSHRSSFGSGRRRGKAGNSELTAEGLRNAFSCLGIGMLVFFELAMVVGAPMLGVPLAIVTVVAFWLRGVKRRQDPEWQFQQTGRLASQCLAAGDLEGALTLIEKCEALVPGKPVVAGLRGQILFQLGRYDQAITHLKVGTNSDTERLMLAESLRHTSAFRESLAVLATPVTDASLADEALMMRGANHLQLNEPEIAIEILKAAPLRKRNLDETLKQIHYCLASAYEKTGDKSRAVQHLRRIYAADPQFMNVQSELARLSDP